MKPSSNPEPVRSFMIGQAPMRAKQLEPALYLVATPIGNLGDVTLRALEVLAASDVLACEDTRVTRVLLERYGIRRRTTAYHEHNAAEAGPRLIAELEAGKSVALVSDAGTPLISDPGFRLVDAALNAGIKVVPVPGASSLLAALAASGLPTDAFFFAGFLPVKNGQRKSILTEMTTIPGSLIFLESPRRLAASLAAMAEVFAGRPAAVCRELTKAFEEIRRGSISELAAHYESAGAPKGEIVICVGPPAAGTEARSQDDIDKVLLSLAAEMPAAKAAAEAARMTGGRKGDLYRRLLALRDDGQQA